MAIRNAPTKHDGDPGYQRLRRKADQAWDMAGLARQDGDKEDEKRRTDEARDWERQLREYIE
jgi:hypothetical protein